MKRNFNKEFKEEFKKSFDNGLDKETLKENLNLVPQEEDTIKFKKKPFYGLSSLFAALLIIVTASITFLVTYYADHNGDNFHCQSEEVDVVDFFQNKYKQSTINVVCKICLTDNVEVSLVHISTSDVSIFAMYFHDITKLYSESLTYDICINNQKFSGEFDDNCQYIEYNLISCDEYDLHLLIQSSQKLICDFCIKF